MQLKMQLYSLKGAWPSGIAINPKLCKPTPMHTRNVAISAEN